MTIWRGIQTHTTPVDSTPGISEWQQNTRMLKAGELQRRTGFQSTAIAKQSGAIYEIMSATGLGSNFLTFDLGATIDGRTTAAGSIDVFPPPPVGPKRRRPDVVAGNPVAPVIVFITASPPSPQAYVVGNVTFTPTINYDGLSGPLIYLWSIFTVGPALLSPATPTNPTCVYDFHSSAIPATYSGFILTVSTTLNGFVVTSGQVVYLVT